MLAQLGDESVDESFNRLVTCVNAEHKANSGLGFFLALHSFLLFIVTGFFHYLIIVPLRLDTFKRERGGGGGGGRGGGGGGDKDRERERERDGWVHGGWIDE